MRSEFDHDPPPGQTMPWRFGPKRAPAPSAQTVEAIELVTGVVLFAWQGFVTYQETAERKSARGLP